MSYALFNIAADKIVVCISEDLSALGKTKTFKTPLTFTDGMSKLTAAIAELAGDGEIEGVAGGVRGALNETKEGIENDGVLKKWVGFSIVDAVQKEFNVPVYLENDTAIAGVGEAVYGAGKGLEIIAYHHIDAGVGGAKIENGIVDLASVGFEPGHQVLDIDRTILGDDIAPTLENLISTVAIKERYGADPKDIPQDDVLWKDLAGYLAQGLRNTILYWSPDAIILGGALIHDTPHLDIDDVRKYTVEALEGFVVSPLIVRGKLGNDAALWGAMAILQQASQ
jgi:fructokinase